MLNGSRGQPESLLSTKYDGVEMAHMDGHISILLPWDLNPTLASSHTEGLKRAELQLLLWIGAKRETPFSWDRDVLSCRAGLFLQRVHQAVEAIPLLCHALAGKFAWLGFVVMVSRMDLAGGAGLLWGGTVLVLAGIELIFFTVAGMGLCFGFVLKTVLITQGRFSYR